MGRYGERHAHEYVEFLRGQVRMLARSLNPGKSIDGEDRYAILQKKARKYGHVVVFSIREDTLFVSHFYHTSQDWQNNLDSP